MGRKGGKKERGENETIDREASEKQHCHFKDKPFRNNEYCNSRSIPLSDLVKGRSPLWALANATFLSCSNSSQ